MFATKVAFRPIVSSLRLSRALSAKVASEGASDVPVSLTDDCVRRISELGKHLRVSVDGGGCSGFMYNFTMEDTPQERDEIIEQNGVKVLVDPESMPFLKGCTIDYQKEMISSSFRVQSNPNSSSRCGCGRSFNANV
eukprot:TRINITY_DN1261_c0_g1_i1.p1 TRINITY_DN1261_c0_g1~~TRINITY_DN1261_c0_g1_i1.p1  ORF type:complete len:137 (+),score=30.12 TRINITY_DN1261_c0_g1_i1:56-466(+)